MDLYLTAGFGEPLGSETLALIRRLGFCGIKQDLPDAVHQDAVWRELETESWLKAILLAKPVHIDQLSAVVHEMRTRGLVQRTAVEVIGEPDTNDQTAPGLHAALMRVLAITYPDITWVLGGVSGLHKRGVEFLKATMAAGVPHEVVVSVHPYRTTRTPDDPFYFRTRADEFAWLKTIADGRRIWSTECGWHTAPHLYTSCFFIQRTRTWTEDQVETFTRRELALHRDAGIEVFAWFQFNDGDLPEFHEHHYGLRRLDGSLKPVADVFRSLA